MDLEKPWEPDPIPAEDFHREGEHANINRAPYDRIGGVVYKRAAHIVRVRYSPADPAPDMPDPWKGTGHTDVRWLFSEQDGSEEKLLVGRTFEFMHDTFLDPGASTGMRAHPDSDEVFYVISGTGQLYHRMNTGSPIVSRALRAGDAALVYAGEYHAIANIGHEPLHLIVIGLKRA